ncbi:Protein CBG23910 [Caenorhabditis briggsae]|uniref:Protein CBG23910 n=1 Tax=Caenorhabditis briggsae TaxID=6238 RepID=A8WJK1_CAEBR|nr:Protein CBG23910 [Caenorhabditis briggsae]CAP20644.1 Protein CBG23910 [Caenorhabditis briggsae]
MSEFSIKRPTASETDDDLQQMQEEWSKIAQKPSVEVHRMKKRTKMAENELKKAENPSETPGNSNLAPKIDKNGSARFQIDLDDDQTAKGVLFPIQEHFLDLAGNSNFAENSNFEYSKDDGFPEPLDLSAYFKSGRSLDQSGRSFFAQEFDRIHGDLAENLDEKSDFLAENLAENPKNPDFRAENEQYLKSLDPQKIDNLMAEIKERFDPQILEFLKNRGAKKAENPPGHAPKISKFKAQRLKKGAEPIQKGAELPQTTTGKGAELPQTADDRDKPLEKGAEPITKNVEEMMNELEVLDEWAGQEDQEKYNRLATDAIQLDLTAKFSRNLAQRQQRNAVKLFDNCKFKLDAEGPSDALLVLASYANLRRFQPFLSYVELVLRSFSTDFSPIFSPSDALLEGPSDALLELARSQIDEIKRLYLEEHSDGHQVIYEFGKGVNPILDQCWSLIPIRRVLDTVERRQGHVSQDDVEICRLSILWTYMLWAERRSAFFAFAEPNDFYIHLAELFLIGPEILADDVIKKATRKLLEDYVLVQAIAGKINIRMSQKLAGLDAFMPFYEQLIKCYEQYSMGDNDFTMAILIGAYLNAPVGERILLISKTTVSLSLQTMPIIRKVELGLL